MTLPRISILGCGWLGFPLARALVKSGFSVHGSTTSAEKCPVLKEAGIAPYRLTCGAKMEGDRISEFFQSAILVITIPFRRDFQDPWEYKIQMDGIIAQAQRSSVQAVIFTSSTSVYPAPLAIAREDQDFQPDNLRSKVLLTVERDLLDNSHFKTTVIRFAGLCGETRQVGRFLAGQKDLAGGDEPVNLIHLDDCVQILMEVIQKGIWGEIFNACADEHPSRRQLYTAAAKRLNLPPPVFTQAPGASRKVVSNEKIRQRLNYRFQHPNPLEF
jgi:nucleoside-diphosphate-sugar epimerase